MTKRRSGHFYLMLFIALLLTTTAVCGTATWAVAQQPETKSASNLSKVNWDDETDEAVKTEDATVDGKLSKNSWEDEDSSETATEESGGLQSLNQKDLKALEFKEFMIHSTGFLLFFGYIVGGILTAFFTRNRKIAVAYPPELLILLHTFWPLELILLLFLGKSIR